MAFKAVDQVDVLDYDFKPFVDAEGVTPEPSQQQIRDFQRAIKEATSEVVVESLEVQEKRGERKTPSAEELRDALSRYDETDEEQGAILEAIVSAIGEVCSSQPSAAEIDKLPWRVKQHFIGYIMGKFLGETSALATTP